MASLTKYAGTISQTTGGNYRSFSDLNNLKNNVEGSWANSNGNIKGKSSSPNRPSTLSFTNFGFNLPTGAEVSKIVITYRHKKTGSLSIGAPTISLLGIGGFSSKAVAPKTSMETHTKSFYADGSKNNNLITPTTNKVTRSTVNSSSFGVKVDYPANTNSSEGTLSISYVRVTVEYKVPSYALTLKKVSGGYNEESYTVEASISNTNLTSYNPSCTLTAPTGFSFTDFNGSGEYTMVSPTTISWNPKFSSKVASSTASFKFDVDVTYPSGQTSYTGTFTLSESLYSGSKSLSATITDRPAGEGSETDPDAPPIITDNDNSIVPLTWHKSTINEIIQVGVTDSLFSNNVVTAFAFPCDNNGNPTITAPSSILYLNDEVWRPVVNGAYTGAYYWLNTIDDVEMKGTEIGRYVIYLYNYDGHSAGWEYYESTTPVISYFVEVIPSEESLTTPFMSILEPTEEELNRLGDRYTYICQSDIKHNTDDTFTRDWYKNIRIGVFNNRLKPLFEDKAITGNKNTNWTNYSNRLTVTVSDDGTLLNKGSSNGYYFVNNSQFIYSDYVCEFDIVEVKGQAYWYHQASSSSTQDVINFASYTVNGKHIKMICSDGVMKVYADNVQLGSDISLTTSTPFEMGFRVNTSTTQDRSIKYKNFVVYDTLTDINNLSPQQIYENAEYWSKATGGLNEYNNCECEFTYDEEYPLYILMTGDYPEAEDYGYDMGSIKYDTPCIVEKQVYNGREASGNYPLPIEALLDGEDIATLQLAKDQTSQGAVLYDFPVDETISTNDKLAIRGLQVRANIEATDNLVIQAQLHSPNGEVGNRSILVDSNDEEIVIGGLGDLWGFTTLQMTHLELWQLELSVANILSQSDSSILFNNVEIIFYLETVEKQEITIRVEDEDIAYYGAFIETVKIPEGLNTDTSFLSIDGTDTNDAYRQNIREKTITIEFNLSNCELQTSTDMLRQLTKLFVNEKDQYNRPIPKRIQFSHYPNDYFEYIMEEPFDVDTDITDYTIKAQLTVPSGTSYSLYDTVTNTTGNANGLAAVNPIITVRPSDVNIQVSETNSGQVFQIAYTGDWNDHTVEIDCEDRKVYLIKGEDERIDISKYADYNSDWFRLDGEYEFSSVNCTILSVIFNERW